MAADGGRNDPAAAAKFTEEIKAFVASGEQSKSFPPTLTAADRKIVHDICYELDLVCKSRGPKTDGRFICPFYTTTVRGPTFVFAGPVRTNVNPNKWILAGACLVMQPD